MRNHNKSFHIRLTDKEFEKLTRNAKRCGLPKSTYVRFMIDMQQPKERPPVDYWKFHSMLCEYGNDLHHLGQFVRDCGLPSADVLREFCKMQSEFHLALDEELRMPERLERTDLIKQARAWREEDEKAAQGTE